jgi:hypothetical protein
VGDNLLHAGVMACPMATSHAGSHGYHFGHNFVYPAVLLTHVRIYLSSALGTTLRAHTNTPRWYSSYCFTTAMQENPFWSELRYQCYRGGHLAQTIITAILVALFVTLCTLFTLVYFDSNPLSSNLGAKAHGRADFVFLCVKTLLVVLVEVFPHAVGANALAGIVCASSVALVLSYAQMMPFLHHSLNKLMLAITSMFAWFSVCLVVAQIYQGFDAAVMLYTGAPVAALAGSSLADWRSRRIMHCTVSELSSVYDLDLKLRYFLHSAIWGDATVQLRFGGGIPEIPGDGHAQQAATTAAVPTTPEELDGIDDDDERIHQVRNLLPKSTLKAAEGLLRAGVLRFKHSALVHIFAARFYCVYCSNHHLEMRYVVMRIVARERWAGAKLCCIAVT